MKRVLGIVVTCLVICAAAAAAWWGYQQVFVDSSEWYVQVDNARLTKADENNNGFDYHYDLPAADAQGKQETLGFDASHELREGAYLKLETLALRGVVSWEEVSWDEIPAAAQDKLSAPDAASAAAPDAAPDVAAEAAVGAEAAA
ncbi:YxeA family protein [Collinsella sp. An2]|uniref:YxeA family protein n=1 Tax=Collinsella sp. An2 TaxID=1965585 RepID=UPI000B3730AE|nr:YxeA family protein [Collinsella sp. An2]OUP07306.1 hypothetical protein B5F33_09070 [Collinsella sp. An2]